MADRFFLDPDAAHAAFARLRTAGEQLLAEHRSLTTILESRHGCWGDDDIGRAFAKNYVDFAAATRTNTELLGENAVAVADYGDGMTDDLVGVDADNARQIADADDHYADNVRSWSAPA